MSSINQSMNLILIHRNSADNNGESMLRFALTNEPLAGVVLDGLRRIGDLSGGSIVRLADKKSLGKIFYAIPEEWNIERLGSQYQSQLPQKPLYDTQQNVIRYENNITVPSECFRRAERGDSSNSWFVVSNGRFAAHMNIDLLENILAGVQADVVAVNVKPALLGQREKVRLTSEGKLAGFCRAYSDSAEFAFISDHWPHHLFVKTDALERALVSGALPCSFSAFVEKCSSSALTIRAINVGGIVLDLEAEDGFLSFCKTRLSQIRDSKLELRNSDKIHEHSRFIGKVLLGQNVQVGPDVIVIGPTIISHNTRIEQGAVINSSIIGPEVCVPKNQFVQSRVIKSPQFNWAGSFQCKNGKTLLPDSEQPFRVWPRISYARCIKRIADFFAAAMVLILFAPVMLFVALAIKLTSPGPVFYKDKRQGLHGKEFNCLKFRTMILGADKIQEILRIVSQVDGPQFKIADDPRINTVGRFLRETYIDEIPQFFNVLFGQMSIVGPRPSPKSENTLCPFWRDARLSVKPGITGLWQVFRTREPMRDFQEWIHYDIEYVRNLSLKMDLYICWKTAVKLLGNFINQF
jgi:lipopolysaccharide/colanic/teichoic acid biosynthesis glycosyltransferase